MSSHVRSAGFWVSAVIVLLGLSSAACSGRKIALLDPVAPEAVGAFTRSGAPNDEAAGTWTFSASIDHWQEQYVAPDGRRLTIYAFLFPTPSVAGDTYEASRRSLKSGGGGFAKVDGAHVAGVYGMRMEDANGDYFEFHRGCWVVILEGDGAAFEEAVRAIRWVPAQVNG